MALPIRLKHPIYDCFYLALAEREQCAVVTADLKLLAAAKSVKGVQVRPL
jgi:predicted nucleic acid-binding protein